MTEVVVERVAPNRVVVSSPGPQGAGGMTLALLQDVTAASSDFADFQTRIAALGGSR